MFNRSGVLVYVIIIASLASWASTADAQFEGMLSRVPRDANTLILIDADKLFGSPLADRERWDAKRKAAFDAGVSALPPDASSIVMAARTDFENGRNDWELSLVQFPGGRDVTSVAKRFGGAIDTISGRAAAKLPDDHYVVQISPNLLGTHTPARRQDVVRWLLATDQTNVSSSMSPYLMQAYGYSTKIGTPIVMAIDLSGVLSPSVAAERLAQFESLSGKTDQINAIAVLAESIQGATLGITVSDKVTGAIRVDFASAPTLSADVMKPILLEVLKRHGAMVDDFETWQPSLQGNTLMLKGSLTTASTRRVLSILELPPALAHSLDVASNSGSSAGGPNPSQLYFQAVSSLLDDLRMKPKTDGVKTAGQVAMWYDKYARKIDKLPILGVDSTLLNYGADMASGLRDANSALRGIGMRSAVRKVNNDTTGGGAGPSYGGYYNNGIGGYGGAGYSYFDLRSGGRIQSQENAAIQTQERVSGVATVQSIWKNIDEATAMIRREMTQKFEIEF
jgi:hypothetical protein